jgi:hypothetical protein
MSKETPKYWSFGGFVISNPRALLLRLLVVFGPVYLVAALWQQMVVLLPILASLLIFTADVGSDDGDATDADG